MWLLEGVLRREFVFVPGVLIAGLTVLHNARHREWGFAWAALGPGLWRALGITFVMVLIVLGAGAAVGTLHDRRDFSAA